MMAQRHDRAHDGRRALHLSTWLTIIDTSQSRLAMEVVQSAANAAYPDRYDGAGCVTLGVDELTGHGGERHGCAVR